MEKNCYRAITRRKAGRSVSLTYLSSLIAGVSLALTSANITFDLCLYPWCIATRTRQVRGKYTESQSKKSSVCALTTNMCFQSSCYCIIVQLSHYLRSKIAHFSVLTLTHKTADWSLGTPDHSDLKWGWRTYRCSTEHERRDNYTIIYI